MKEPKRRQSLSGAVLIMILTVMFVLIILLTATLTTVTTANQRIYTKFEENQAYYTARSALDVFTQNMLDDDSYYSYKDSGTTKISYIHGDNVTADIMMQGLALQLDLYSITAKDGMNITQAALYSYADTITGDPDTAKDEYLNYFGTKPTPGALNIVGSDIGEVWYEIELPAVSGKEASGDSHDFGKLSDGRKARIKVEILERKYDMGDKNFTSGHGNMDVKTYLNTLSEADLNDFFNNLSAGSADEKDVAEAIAKGNRKKDRMRIKITATAEFDGVEGTAVLIYDSNEPPVNNSSRAITAFGGTGSDNMSILGGMAAENTINWGSNNGFIYGPVYVEEDFLMTSNGPKIYLNSGENIVVGGDLQIQNNSFQVTNTTSPLVVDDENAPFVFIGGELRTGGGLGSSPFMNIDVVTQKLNIGGKIEFDSSCTIYCKDFVSNCGSNSKYDGDIYVNGDVTIFNDNDTKITWGGDPLTPTVVHGGSGTIHFTGKIIEGSTGTDVTAGAGAGFDKMTSDTTFWNDVPQVSKITNPLPAEADDTGEKIEFKLPGRSDKKQIETHAQNFDNYYVKDADGKRVTANVTITKPDGSTETQTRPVVKSPQIMADISTMSDKTLPFTSANTGITDNLSDLTTPSDSGNYHGMYFNKVLNTGGGDIKAIWNFDNQNIYIRGGGTVVLQLNSSYSNDNTILVEDDTTLKIIGDTSSGDLSFAKLEVYNQTTWGAYKNVDAGEGKDALKVGNLSGKGIKVPKIYYYFTGGNKFKVQNNCLLTGYIYAPDTEIDMAAASTGMPTNGMEYNGNTVTSTPVCIVGSALVKGAKLPNNTGVAYINPDLDDDTPGKPIHNWQTYQYVRN